MLRVSAIIGLALVLGSFVWLMLAGLFYKLRGTRPRSGGAVLIHGLMFWGGLGWLGLLFAIAGGKEAWQSWRSQAWVATEVYVVRSSVDTVRRNGSDRYRPAVTYRYTVDGTAYESSRIAYNVPLCSHREAEAMVADRFAAGAVLAAYVNPRNPAVATLEPGLAADRLFIFALGVLCLGVSGYGFRRFMLYGPFR